MKTLLITGATGFIGKRLLAWIKATNEFSDYNIVTLASTPSDECVFVDHCQYSFNKEDFYKLDVNNVDIVLHMGAFIPKSSNDINDIESSTSNINNTIYLINNLPNIPDKFIFISSVDVYSYQNNLNEESIPNPSSLYGMSKLYCEKIVEKWAESNGVILNVLRLGHIYGEGEEIYQKLIPVTIQRILKCESPVLYTSGDETRQFLYIDDVCKMILKSIGLGDSIGPVNVVSSRLIKLRETVELLLQLSDSKLKIEFIDKTKTGVGYSFDNSKMLSFLGKEEISFEDGLKKEIEYLKDLYGKK